MKKTLLFCMIIPVMIGSCTSEKKTPLEGEWILAHEYEMSGGKTTVLYPGEFPGTEIKIWSGDYWVLLGRFEEDSTYSDVYAGGTYTLDGSQYAENVQYHSAPEYLGQIVKLSVEVKKDTIIQTWPVDEDGQIIESGIYYIEKWARIK